MTTTSVDLNIVNGPTEKGPESSPAEAGMLYWYWRLTLQSQVSGGAPMPGKKKSSSIKNPKTYEGLKKKGMPKSRAAAISNAQAKKKKKK
jgi:hypothetical protein